MLSSEEKKLRNEVRDLKNVVAELETDNAALKIEAKEAKTK